MPKKLLEGFVFGIGFSLAVMLVMAFVMPRLMPAILGPTDRSSPVDVQDISSAPTPKKPEFYELSVEEQIKQASVIALARYEASPDGKMKAVIREFLKKDPDAVIHYRVGDEVASASFYPSEGQDHGDGVVVFFVGSPATVRMSTSYFGNRIRGLADIPIELFRKKCEAPNA